MSKELEAFKGILNKRCGYCPFNHEDMSGEECEECDRYDDIIEAALKNYESCDKERMLLIEEKHFLTKECLKLGKENDKLKKALEVIKKKNVNIDYLQNCCFEDYNNLVEAEEELTQEEFDLLKFDLLMEVLL